MGIYNGNRIRKALKAGYFSDITEDALNDTLRSLWAPEVKLGAARELSSPDKSMVSNQQPLDECKRSARESVFYGLQSLLVNEASDSDDDTDDGDESTDDGERSNYDEPILASDSELPSCGLVDLSGLNLDARTYLHLRRVGLVSENHQPPDAKLPVNGLESNSPRGERDYLDDGVPQRLSDDDHDETLEDIVARMSADLVRLNKLNNARASFLESAARTHISVSEARKRMVGKETVLVTKCQQLVKKNKDSKVKSSKPKTASKDEYALPW